MEYIQPSAVEIKKEIHAQVRDIILKVEQVLQALPQADDKVEVKTIAEKKAPAKQSTIPNVVSSEKSNLMTETPEISCSTKCSRYNTKVVPGSVYINHLPNTEGITVDVDVKVTPQSGSSRLIKMTVECPNFVPCRLRCDNQWYNIV